MADVQPQKPAIERLLELWLFRSRWLLAPIYLGLAAALAALLATFVLEMIHLVGEVGAAEPKYILPTALSMIDVSLLANLVLLVIFSGYEQFVSRIEPRAGSDRLSWMGAVDFAGLKLRLIASLVAISAVALLRAFTEISDGATPDNRSLAWMVGIHLTFVVSGALLALMDFIAARARRSGA
jgi:uncharacterized protein (TIGR00645 family)